MRYFLDTEFFGYGGEIISLALVPENTGSKDELYIAFDQKELEAESWISDDHETRKWVRHNVLPIIDASYATAERIGQRRSDIEALWPARLDAYFADDPHPHIIADFPSDIHYFSHLLITSRFGDAIRNVRNVTFEWVRDDAYPTDLAGAVQHNALWDARALKHHMLKKWRK